MTTVAFYTLGCRSNQYETDVMSSDAAFRGFEIVTFDSISDVYVINTCTVTGNADRKARNVIRQAKKINPASTVIVTGCYVDSGRLDIEGIDIKLLNKDKPDISGYLLKKFPEVGSTSSRSRLDIRSNLMIENGCENFCSYCIVPYIRGKISVKPVSQAVEEAERMVAGGVKEIVLTGINLGEHPELIKLIKEITKIDGLLRIRLSSIEPMYVTDELIELIKSDPKICHHLHIPLQSGDDGVLKSMKRTYTSKDFIGLTNKIVKKIKDIAITTDIIVGFPGEDDKAFLNTCKVIDKIKFARIHIFSYSDRPGTEAFTMKDKVDTKIVRKRYDKLVLLRDKYALEFNKKIKTTEVLIENVDKGAVGMTGNYVRYKVNNANDKLGKIVRTMTLSAGREFNLGRMIADG